MPIHMQESPKQWELERAYFDSIAAQAGHFDINLIAPRYERAMRRPLYPLEVDYSLMGNIEGKRVLDVGCGNGENSLLFARWGAQVTGVDISSGAIEVSRARAREHGLTSNTNFVQMPFELVANSEQPFDIVWCAAFLHHVLDRLDDVVFQLRANLTDTGRLMMLEPVRHSQLLKRVRSMVPPFAVGTPDERPLEDADLAKIYRVFGVSARQLYGPVSRLSDRFVLRNTYETSGTFRRTLAHSLYKTDRWLTGQKSLSATAMTMVANLAPLG